jgi:hypothetical protein
MSGGNGGTQAVSGAFCDRGDRFDRIDARFEILDDGLGRLMSETAEAKAAAVLVSNRVGLIRDDGTVTPHSLTAAVIENTNTVLALKRAIEQERPISSPPMPDWGPDVGEITRIQPAPIVVRRMKDAERAKAEAEADKQAAEAAKAKAERMTKIVASVATVLVAAATVVEVYLKTRHP